MERIKKLGEKAELTRHIHGELERKKRKQGRALYAGVQLFGVATSIAAAAYFRVIGQESSETLGGVLLWVVMIFPAIGTALVILDATVFRLRDQEEKHKKGVELWGDWIRRASTTREGEDKIPKKSLEKRYRKCMKEAPNLSVSRKKFNEHKRDWIEKKNQSIELDKEKKWNA